MVLSGGRHEAGEGRRQTARSRSLGWCRDPDPRFNTSAAKQTHRCAAQVEKRDSGLDTSHEWGVAGGGMPCTLRFVSGARGLALSTFTSGPRPAQAYSYVVRFVPTAGLPSWMMDAVYVYGGVRRPPAIALVIHGGSARRLRHFLDW